MSKTTWPYRLLAPGPVPVPPTVLERMAEKVLHHRTPEFEECLQTAWGGLKKVFGTEQSVQILTGTGSAAMEAAIVNTLSPGDSVLVVVSGKFGERWAAIAKNYGVNVQLMNVPWGEPVNLKEFEAQLQSHPEIQAVFTQACETSTATLHPIRAMAELVHRLCPQALFAVDAITAVGCLPMPMDEWELDVVVSGSQKAFMIPTGLSFLSLSERAWVRQKTARLPKFYFDLASERAANEKGQTHFSTPTNLVTGLAMVLKQIEVRGLENLFRRTQVLSEATRLAAPSLGLRVFSKSPSPSVTALATPAGLDSGKLREWLERERNITIMGGQEQLKGKIVRIGHMGDVRDDDMLALFEALSERLDRRDEWSEQRSAIEQNLRQAEPLFP